MRALVLAIRKLIALIVALLIPGAPVAPQLIETAEANRDNSVILTTAPDYEEELEIEEDDDMMLAPQAAARARDEEFTAVQTWDISATEEDDVTMTFYDTEDVDGLMEHLAGRITALFAPITAYAATTEVCYEDKIVEQSNEYGNNGGANEAKEYKAGTVVVSGTGHMEDFVYNYFLSPQKYITTVEAALEDYYKADVTPVYDATIEDVIELDNSVEWYFTGTDEIAEITPEVAERINPSDLLKYSPKTIVIEYGVEGISDYAFAFCNEITEVIIPATVKTIGVDAFAYCRNLTKVELPQNLESLDYGAFMFCTKLAELDLPANVKYIGDDAFFRIANPATINCANQRVANLLNTFNTPEYVNVEVD